MRAHLFLRLQKEFSQMPLPCVLFCYPLSWQEETQRVALGYSEGPLQHSSPMSSPWLSGERGMESMQDEREDWADAAWCPGPQGSAQEAALVEGSEQDSLLMLGVGRPLQDSFMPNLSRDYWSGRRKRDLSSRSPLKCEGPEELHEHQ